MEGETGGGGVATVQVEVVVVPGDVATIVSQLSIKDKPDVMEVVLNVESRVTGQEIAHGTSSRQVTRNKYVPSITAFD